MEHLWAPWRLEYIKQQKDPNAGCPFCELPKEEPSEENLMLWRGDEVVIFMNKFPYNPGHLLVLPRAHKRYPEDLPAGVWDKLSRALQLSIEAVKSAYNPQGFNVGINLGPIAGAGIPDHLHWHVVPRWGGDTNFMPVIAETKALPSHNRTVYQQLRPHFEKLKLV